MAQGFSNPLAVRPRDYGIVTALPTTTSVGDHCTYNADNTNGVYWRLVYDGVGSYPWKFIGGPPMFTKVDTDETVTSDGAMHDPATAGPSITLPLAGDYSYQVRCEMYTTSATASQLGCGLSVAGSAPAAPDWAFPQSSPAASAPGEPSFTGRLTGRSASNVLKMQYQGNNATTHTRYRILQVTPVRVG